MSPRRILLTSVGMLFVLALAACGGSSSKSSTTTTAAPAANGATATNGGDSATTTVNFSGAGSSNFCSYAQGIESSKSLENAFSGSQSASAVKDGFSQAQSVINTAVGKAPAEIKADLQTMQTGFKAIADFYATYGYDVAKLTAAIQKDPTVASKVEAITGADFTAASGRVDAYIQQVCGIKSN